MGEKPEHCGGSCGTKDRSAKFKPDRRLALQHPPSASRKHPDHAMNRPATCLVELCSGSQIDLQTGDDPHRAPIVRSRRVGLYGEQWETPVLAPADRAAREGSIHFTLATGVEQTEKRLESSHDDRLSYCAVAAG
ncbi:hypothetical protein PoB_007086000 [Plakobranchus ocellatus]|uniref:Uncharacterized protein n=1 Tax=Plakobranchus ocellatus TaxID=259542 RepID=A0AAV4DK16_9GAST|nr:hypothetical protein PoB_007086000 [Plakobranchus ocellatus]